MNLRKLIILLICVCTGLPTQEVLCADSKDQQIAEFTESTCSSTQISSSANTFAITSVQSFSVPNLRTNGFRRNTNHTNTEATQSVKEISKRYFTKTTDQPSLFQRRCSSSGDYLITIGILVI